DPRHQRMRAGAKIRDGDGAGWKRAGVIAPPRRNAHLRKPRMAIGLPARPRARARERTDRESREPEYHQGTEIDARLRLSSHISHASASASAVLLRRKRAAAAADQPVQTARLAPVEDLPISSEIMASALLARNCLLQQPSKGAPELVRARTRVPTPVGENDPLGV